MKTTLIKLAFWILNRYKVNYFLYPDEKKQILINALVDQVEGKFSKESGEFKRSKVLLAAINSLPEMSEREIALAIELAIQREKRV